MESMARKPAFRIKEIELEAAKSAFGPASRPYRVELGRERDELVEVEIPLDLELCRKREVNLATVRVFRWDEEAKGFRVVDTSRIGDRWRNARARISESGIYMAAGASLNPWVGNAVATLRLFRPLLRDPRLGSVVRDRLCPVILCPNMLGNIFEEIGDPQDYGMSPLPPGDLCDICVDGNPDWGLDLYPEPPDSKWPSGPRCDLDEYLDANPRIRRAIVWRDPSRLPYDDWSDDRKTSLAAAFNIIRWGGQIGLPETVPATAVVPGEVPRLISIPDAWEAYIAHIAHTLVVDACGWVDWTIRGLSAELLRRLLDANGMFGIWEDGFLMYGSTHGIASHGDPTRVYDWLRDEGIIGPDETTTIGRLLEWGTGHMAHYLGGIDPDNMEAHWGYPGFPPVERIIAGTETEYGTLHYTAGCWGTSGFLRLVLRTVNIPATHVTNCGHAQPFFPTIERYLTHGDDIYNANTRAAAAPGIKLLVEPDTFNFWFDPLNHARCDNIGRRPRELAEAAGVELD